MAGSRWVRLDVDYFRNPKALAAGREGRLLHLASICWVGSQLTDGVIPAQAVPSLVADAGAKSFAIQAVIDAGLWIPNGGSSYELHDYVAMNGSRADVERERESWRQRQARARERHGGSHGGSHG